MFMFDGRSMCFVSIKMNLSVIKITNYKQAIFLLVIILVITNITSATAQKPRTRKLADTRFTEHYRVLDTDTSILDGRYELYYKQHLIEKGQYKNGVKSGIWSFYNLNNFFEFQYDFTRDTLLRITGSAHYARKNYTPPIFLGSPLIPYIHILKAINYPSDAYDNNIQGKVVLTLIISSTGDIVDSFISESLNEMMDEVVHSTVKGFPKNWKWLPAKRNGEKIESTYKITVLFDLD